jgi:hypothetical protein
MTSCACRHSFPYSGNPSGQLQPYLKLMTTKTLENSLAVHRYQAGLAGFNKVLDAQRALLLLQIEPDQSNGTATASLVRLYKALGGGWEYDALAVNPVESRK